MTSPSPARRCSVRGCGRPADTFVCNGCWSTLAKELRAVDWLSQQLDLVLSRQTRAGNVAVGFVSGNGERPLPFNLGASEAYGRLRDVLGSWVADLHETNALRWEECTRCGAIWHGGDRGHERPDCGGEWESQLDPLTVDNTAPALAAWLLRHPSWIRLHPAADDLFDEATSAVAWAWRLIDRRPDMTYLGICAARVVDEDAGDEGQCQAPLYVEQDAQEARCRRCHASHIVADRRRSVAVAVEDQIVPTGVLVGLVGALGKLVTSSTIRNLKARNRITPKVRDRSTGYIRLRCEDDPGPDMFRVGDVLDAINEPRLAKKAPISA